MEDSRRSNGYSQSQGQPAYGSQPRYSGQQYYPTQPYYPGQRQSASSYGSRSRPSSRRGKRRRKQAPDSGHHLRNLRNHVIAATGEFVGTVIFLWFAFAWHEVASLEAGEKSLQGSVPSSQTVLYISLGYGFSLLVAAWAFYRISGGLFNPAVTLGMVLAGTLPVMRGIFLFPTQIIAGIAAAALVSWMFPGDIAVVNTTLSSGTSTVQGLFIEMFLTSLLLFVILMLAAEKSKVTFMAPLGIGLALFVAELAGVYYTGGSLNPARTFGPAVVSGVWVGYQWIYWIGPFLGSLLVAGAYRLIKLVDYEQVNPGQDSAGGDFSA